MFSSTFCTRVVLAFMLTCILQIVVDRQSAVLNLGGFRERREALNADHSAMCKIGNKGPMYDGIVGKIRDLVDEALDWYEARCPPDGANDVSFRLKACFSKS